MTVTRRDPSPGGSGSGSSDEPEREDERAVPFDAFLEWLSVDAKARNDTAWLEWYAEWLKNLPEGDGREDYMARSRADYEARTGETVDEHMDRARMEMLDRLIEADLEADLEANLEANIKDATDHQIMVKNFEIFQREYVDMTVRRSC